MSVQIVSNFDTSQIDTGFDGKLFYEVETRVLNELDCLDFDFSNDLFMRSDVKRSDLQSDESNHACEFSEEKKCVVKSASQKRGSQFMKKVPHSSKYKSKSVVSFVGTRPVKPNMSRRTKDTMLYAFPSFDRCDSLLFFPSTLARLLNAGDIPSVTKLFLNHFDKNCTYGSSKETCSGLTLQSLVRRYEILDAMLPDRITCIRSTQVDGNIIRALSYSKFTSCRMIYDALASSLQKTEFAKTFPYPWANHVRHKMEEAGWSPEAKSQYLALIHTGCDMVVYTRMEYTLTIDPLTKKVINYYVDMRTTSIHEANHGILDQY